MREGVDRRAWALVLGGSSGIGFAAAQTFAQRGRNVAIVHRDRRGSMAAIEARFDAIRQTGAKLLAWNTDALDPEIQGSVLGELEAELEARGERIDALVHSIAFGNLKLIAPEVRRRRAAVPALAEGLGVEAGALQRVVDALLCEGVSELGPLATPAAYSDRHFIEDEDMARTIYAMGTSLLTWTQRVHARGLFAKPACVLGLTSEGNEIAWKGYAAVSAAKAVLESVARSIAVEMAPVGLRANIVQAGVTDTPALRLIPGAAHLLAQARLRNPSGRLTTPADVAQVLWLLAQPEAVWINGQIVRADGGEHIAGSWS